jgi:hypothetical protein
MALACIGTGCRKFIEVEAPVTSVNSGNVYQNDNTAIAVLTEMYTNFMLRTVNTSTIDDGVSGVSWVTELTGDNLTLEYLTGRKLLSYYQNALEATGNINAGTVFWNRLYEYIYKTNAALEGITASAALTPAVKTQLLGECHFIRAFCYFYLVNLYGDAALVLTSDYEKNALLPRIAAAEIYKQIIVDLTEAKSLLKERYVGLNMVTESSERIRVNKGAATALLARVYLYTSNYVAAEAAATEVINNNLYSLVTDNVGNVFLKNSKETIWSMQPTLSTTQNTWESFIFPLTKLPSFSNPVSLSANLVATFDAATDKRFKSWIGAYTNSGKTYYYAYKYKAGSPTTTVTEYEMVLRLAEQYLIRAEARAQQNNITGTGSAAEDLNIIRSRAGLGGTTAANKADMIDAVLLERRKEFFTEWGHRWFDLKRLGKIDAVMQAYAPVKGATWEPYKALYPILQSEIALNPGMTGQQNQGY